MSLKPLLANKILPLMSFQVSSFILPWLATIWFTYQQGLHEAGQFSYFLAIISPISMLLASPSRNFILTQQSALSLALKSRLLLLVVGVIAISLLAPWLTAFGLLISLFFVKMAELSFDIPISVAVHQNNVASLWRLNVYKWLIILLLVGVALSFNNIIIVFVLGGAAFLWVVYQQSKVFSTPAGFGEYFKLISASLPLGLSALIFSVHFNLPRYVIGAQASKEMLAIYSISSFLIMAAVVLINIFVQAKLPAMKKLLDGHYQLFKKELYLLCGLALAIYFLMQLAQTPLFSHIFWALHNNVQQADASYFKLYQQILWLAWGPILFSLVNYFLMLTGQHKTLLIITTVNVIVTYILCRYALFYFNIFKVLWAYNFGCVFQACAVVVMFKKRAVFKKGLQHG